MSYTKFVILGQERTGSVLLQMLLASHSNVLSLGEIFNPTEEIRKKIKIAKPLELDGDPIEYLEKYVYKEYPENIKAAGFRLFYSQARNNKWKDVWEYLKSSNIKIIHLKRRNLLDRYLSHQLAKRSNIWIALKDGDGTFNDPITLNYTDCIKDFHRSVWHQGQTDDFFRDNPKIEVVYEDLFNYLAGECRRIQDFLGLEFQELSSITLKQRTKKKSQLITNYDELKKRFILGVSRGGAKAEWIDFFDDE